MPVLLLSKLNPVFYTGFQREITGKKVRLFNSTSSLLRHQRLLSANSGLTRFLPYSSNSISDNRFISNQLYNRAKTMAVSRSKAVFGDVYVDELVASCGNGLDFFKPTGVYFADRSHSSCEKASMILRKGERPNNRVVCGYYICDAMPRNTKYNPPFVPRMKSIHTSSLSCSSATGAAHDVSFDGSSKDEQTASFPKEAIPGERALTLLSGSCYLPHPAKEETGGEDAHFICSNEQAIGVADGVGGWAEVGVDAGEFARELIYNSVKAIQDEPKGSIDPARVLEKAHSSTKSQGSSTACIIALTQEGIHAINLGDSGFIVVRDGCTVFHSPVQQHGFNFTYQLESGDTGDLPSSGQTVSLNRIENPSVLLALFNSLHGVRQRLTCWFDGPAYISQCPIQTGQSFKYRFTLLNQIGTLFWHAHISWLRATVHGPLIIYPMQDVSYPFEPPVEEHVIVLGEYWLQDIQDLERHVKESGGGPPGSDAYILNGYPGPLHNCSRDDVYTINVTKGKNYLLRIINAALNMEHFFGVANHTMTVVETDGEYTKPFNTSFLMLTPGQTYNVLIKADQPIGKYFMAMAP
ncbi:hypothetical protein REPUB_Repub09cG0180400 [Reevesia pubescens]